MTPYGLVRLRHLSQFLPPHVISRERVVLVQAVSTSTLRNYGAGLLRFTQFCDDFNIPESLRMPAPKWLLSIFITTRGAGSVGGGSLRTWLLGLELWHIVNSAPWRGACHLKRATKGAHRQAPDDSSRPKCLPVTLAHLKLLRAHLNLNNTFDATVFAAAMVAFWCQCRIGEVCVDIQFNACMHATRDTPQKGGLTMSNIAFYSFWAPQTKTKP